MDHLPPVCIDFETFYDTKSGCSVKPLGAEAYCRHPEFYAFLVAVYDGITLWVGDPRDLDWMSLHGRDGLAHNAFFEANVIQRLQEMGIIPKEFKLRSLKCTANMSAALCNRRSLADAVQFLLGEMLDKGPRGEMDGKHWDAVKGTDLGARFLKYAGVDAVKSWELYAKYGHLWSPFEQRLSEITIEQCLGGLHIDVPKLEEYLDRAKRLLFQIQLRMPWILEGGKPTSPKAVNQRCVEAGIPCQPVKKHDGEEAYEEWVKTYGPKYPFVAAISQWKSLNKFISSLETIKRRLRPDGVLSFGLKYGGAHTMRWSGDAGFNVQNLKRDPILVDRDGNIRLDKKSANEYWAAKENGTVPDWLDFITDSDAP